MSQQYGASFWAQVPAPDFGSSTVCSTPTLRSTWGSIKLLYR